MALRPSVLALMCAPLLLSCEDSEENNKVLDAVVFAADDMIDAIDAPDSVWLNAVDVGSEVNGELTNEIGGTLTAFGWRNTSKHENESGLHQGYSEKLFVDLNQWNANGLLVTGKLNVTRHYMDFGPPGGSLNDVSRTTRYLATITVDGDVTGSFEVDIHALAAGGTVWTCGVVNGSGVEHGPCYDGQEP